MAQTAQAKVLIYSATREFRHDSIPTAIQALQSKGSSINVVFDNTEDQTQFTDDNLAAYDAVLFLDNNGEVLDDAGKAAFQRYLNRGGNFVGVHSASDCLRNDTFYGNELGAHFDYHPVLQNATVDVIDSSHPSTSMLPAQWKVQDEMYNFKSDPRAVGAVVILSADESSYEDPGPRKFDQGSPHPTAWYQEHGAGVESGGVAGRSFYTSLGHLNETWHDDLFMAHVLGGITWTLQSNTTRAFNSSAQVGNSGAAASSSSTGFAGGASTTDTTGSTSPSANPPSAAVSSVVLMSFLALVTGAMFFVS
ncbi:class I glutamine amidotransferase-like protein [Dendrothele bispora CBS 962.96]|uniref:Class I glutamine amidotransferase-like protein n=1 Tax=Dendrothele bispora (strain CBS 962.96) TaxID=1314807 RepID=A0A4S8MK50_DENBC|nr:class I glutamine amidotransferase-like protein [Dendrothele bispora CBS 962.96]